VRAEETVVAGVKPFVVGVAERLRFVSGAEKVYFEVLSRIRV